MLVLKTLLSAWIWAPVGDGLLADHIDGHNVVAVDDGDFRLTGCELNV